MSSGLLFFTFYQAQKYSPTEFIAMFWNIKIQLQMFFYHTHVVVPAQRDMCNSLKGSCHSPNCFKLHLESFSIASILQLATYKTPAGTFTSCFVQEKNPGH
jgi:hypothetical protein